MRQVRLAAEEKKKELNQHLRESISRERTAQLQSQAMVDKGAMMQQLKAEHRLRKEIQNVNKSMMHAMQIAFKD